MDSTQSQIVTSTKKRSGLVTIDQIIPTGERYIIRVKIMRLWKSWKKTAGNSIEMVVVDEKGTRIHATVEEQIVKKYEKQLAQGRSITINTFDVLSNSLDYKTSPLPIKLNFFKTTLVKPYDDFPVDVEEKYFQTFDRITSGNLDSTTLWDVIGKVINVGPLEESNKTGKQSLRVTVDLIDEHAQLKCTLFADYAKQMIDYVTEHPSPPPVCVMRFVSLKEYRGNWSITNSFSATELLFEPDTEHVKAFKARCPVDNTFVTNNDNSQISFGSITKVDEEFLGDKHMRGTVADILNCDEVGVMLTKATVVSIGEANKWYYNACRCYKKVHPYPEDENDPGKNPKFMCAKCGDVEFSIPRYLLTLNVGDHTGMEAKFLLFDNIAEKLLQCSAAKLVKEVAEEDPTVLPEAIEDLIGKNYLFKITIDEKNLKGYNTAFKVDLFSDDEELMIAFGALQNKNQLMLTNGDEPKKWYASTIDDSKDVLSNANTEESPVQSFETPISKNKSHSSSGSTFDDQNSVTKKLKIEDSKS